MRNESDFNESYLPIIERLEALDDISAYLKLWMSKDENREVELRFFNAELSKGRFLWRDNQDSPVRELDFVTLSQLVNILQQLNGFYKHIPEE